MGIGQYRTRPSTWGVAGLLTVLLHAGLLVAANLVGLFDAPEVQAQEQDVIEVVFAPESPPSSADPTFFSELPPDLAGEAPDQPVALSNVQSRARDMVPGGEDKQLPRLDGQSEAPHVRMDVTDAGDPASHSQVPLPHEPEPPDEPEEEDIDDPVPEEEPDDDTTTLAAPESLRHPQSLLQYQDPIAAPSHGASDIHQDAMSNPDGNAALPGDITLSTTEWAYAPWIQRFRRDVMQRWVAPVGYHLGIIHGWTLVDLEIDRSGNLLRIGAIAKEGHYALHDASIHALRVASPYRPLPAHFPENTLIIQIRMAYPKHQR
jgi:hypothetical protein